MCRLAPSSCLPVIPAAAQAVMFVTIADATRNGKPFKYEWQVDFAEDAREITEAEARAIFDAMMARLEGKLGVRH